MKRRTFLRACAAIVAPLVAVPVRVFIPPREPFVYCDRGSLNGLYSHLGILPSTKTLNICEGALSEIGDWDGTGYPCRIQNVCCFPTPEPEWIYDFDLWNFRHDDHLSEQCRRAVIDGPFPNHATWYAWRRFGCDLPRIANVGGGPMRRWIAQIVREVVQ